MPLPLDEEIEVIVTVDDQQLQQMQIILHALEERGLREGVELQSAGMIIGRSTRGQLSDFMAVSGVAAAEESGGVGIAPPGSDVQ